MLLAMILVARRLGQVSFGELGLIQATLGVAGLMAGVGLGSTATRFVAQHSRTDPGRAGRVVALVTTASGATILLAAVVIVAASGVLAAVILEAPHLQSALRLGSLLMVATALRGIQSGVFAGLERFDTNAKLNLLEGLFSCVAVVPLASAYGVLGVLVALASSSLVVWLVGTLVLGRELAQRGIALDYRNCWADWRILTSYSLPTFLAHLVATPVLWLAMTLVARSDAGLGGLGLYNAAYQWHGPMVFIPMVLMSVSIPTLVQEWEAGRRKRFRQVTFWISALMLAVSVPPVLVASLLSPSIMALYGPSFRDGWMLMVLLLAAAPLHGLAKIASSALYGMNRAWWVLGVNLVWGATILALTAWFLPSLGTLALALGFLVAYGVLAALAYGLVLMAANGMALPKPAKQVRVSE